jgi:hypothetical protein
MRRADVRRKGSLLARCALPRHANGYDARSSEAAFPTTVKDRRRARRIVMPGGAARICENGRGCRRRACRMECGCRMDLAERFERSEACRRDSLAPDWRETRP